MTATGLISPHSLAAPFTPSRTLDFSSKFGYLCLFQMLLLHSAASIIFVMFRMWQNMRKQISLLRINGTPSLKSNTFKQYLNGHNFNWALNTLKFYSHCPSSVHGRCCHETICPGQRSSVPTTTTRGGGRL